MILTRDEFMARINDRVGASTENDVLSFLEDMTDTYNHLESMANSERISELEAENEELRKRYRERFEGGDPVPSTKKEPEDPEDTILTFDKLFKEE